MRVAWYRARAGIRSRRGGLGLALLSAVVVALVLAGIAGARRTTTAFERMLDDYVQPNAAVFAYDPEGADEVYAEVARRFAEAPEVVAYGVAATTLFATQQPDGTWEGELGYSSVDQRAYQEIQRPLVVDGRRADQAEPYEVVVNEAWADRHDVTVGSTVEIGLVPPDQLDAAGNGVPIELSARPRPVEVVGIVRRPGDLAPERRGVEGTIDEGAESLVFFTSAFWAAHSHDVASYGSAILVRLEPASAVADLGDALGDLEVQVLPEGGESGFVIPSIERAVDIEARALLSATLLLGLAGALLLAQAARRQGLAGSAALAAVGMDRRGLALAGALELGVIGLLAAGLGVLGAFALSPLAPIGIAREASGSFGLEVDGTVLAGGALLVVAAFALGGALLGWTAPRRLARAARTDRPSRLSAWLASAGLAPAPAVGIRLATEPGRGDRAVAVRSTLLTGVVGVAALTAAVVFSASLDRVVDDPLYRGWNWDLDVGNYSEPETSDVGREMLLANPGVAAFRGWQADFIALDGVELPLVMFDDRDGDVGPQVLGGRMPSGEGEIALASAALEALDRAVGDTVEAVGPSGEPIEVRIVGETMGVGVIDQESAIDEGAFMTFRGVRPMLTPDLQNYANGYLVRLAEGEAGRRGLAQLREDFPGTVFGARSTYDIENLRRVQWLPRMLAVGVGLIAIGTMAHALASAVRWRRRDLALLKCLGLRSRQLLGITMSQAATVAVIALVIGLPLGIVLARGLWSSAAEEIGTFAGPSIPPGALVVGALAFLFLAIAIALVPGRSAARTPAAAVLRVE